MLLENNMKLEDIIESLNYRATIEWSGDIGIFEINDQKFTMTVRPASAKEQQTYQPFFDIVPKVGNVDFSCILPDGQSTQNLTGLLGNTAMKVFSVVAQGVAELKQRYQYNVLLCVAKHDASPTNFDNRVQAYEVIVERAARKAGMQSMKIVDRPDEVVYAAFDHTLLTEINNIRLYMVGK